MILSRLFRRSPEKRSISPRYLAKQVGVAGLLSERFPTLGSRFAAVEYTPEPNANEQAFQERAAKIEGLRDAS